MKEKNAEFQKLTSAAKVINSRECYFNFKTFTVANNMA